jgi:hypothetical protein
MDAEKIIEAHFDGHDQLSGLVQVYRTYSARYDREDGSTVEVTLQVLRHPEGGWMVRVESEDGKVAASNFTSDLEASLAMIHWERLG